MSGIYIASKAKHHKRWVALKESGVHICSTWIYEGGPDETHDWQDLWDRCISEVVSCDVLIVYIERGDKLNGALVELGIAIGLRKPILVVTQTDDLRQIHSVFNHPRLNRQYGTIEAAVYRAQAICSACEAA